MLHFPDTTPAGEPKLSVDFLKQLPAGVTVLSCVVTCENHDDSAVDDPSPAARLSGSPTVTDGKIVTQKFAGGVLDVDYVVIFVATLSDGQKKVAQGVLSIVRYLNKH